MFLGCRVASLRNQNNISQKELAKGIISISHLSNFENNRYVMSEETLILLAKALNVDTSYLTKSNYIDDDIQNKLDIVSQYLFINPKKAISIISKINPPINSIELELSYYLLKGYLDFITNNNTDLDEVYNSHIIYFEKIIKENYNELPYTLQFSALCFFAFMDRKNNNLEKSNNYLKKLLSLTQYKTDKPFILMCIAKNEYQQNRYIEALDYAYQSRSLAGETADFGVIGQICNFIGVLNLRIFQTKESLFNFNEALRISNILQNTKLKNTALHNLGILYIELGKINLAIDTLKKIDVDDPDINNTNKFLTLISLIKCYLRINEVKKASYLINKLNSYVLNDKQYFLLESQKANLNLRNQNESEYTKIKSKCLDFFIINNFIEEACKIANELGDFYFKKRQYKKSSTFFKKRINLIDMGHKESLFYLNIL
ncbi:TPA: helix-turn-helix domain-containing protein [Bacillus cereus]|uniref:helix-turn-helix domain-containing protein n=1 Tax=Bacillus sp. JAS24-2 TaxID=2217832 RepID=UPI0011ECC507|nr:helix-turn-helix domain-containing protein [Bacillus sp. JAS24-2]HDR4764931.1 helix-turn-helix domain-containing protein [Bacillus cereus]QEL82576.1 helix-turn-helix domain-containing protein [Bacillus sp. JAS24-2]HDR4797934.1 helix-turn-helix domain-containing protein [Bacillus cereus]HDR4804022.1 helix-turn-helix domain-containing protein [Bacillus cereus]HDR4810030.1 helix-turn-helix domain-containing protein [Bacillus cereus]